MKLSIIVPVYNVEPYLRRCIDSILAQTFTDFELILVDDGSPDNCPAICDEYAEKDSRIVVIHKKTAVFPMLAMQGLISQGANISVLLTAMISFIRKHMKLRSRLLLIMKRILCNGDY